jgi:hypothetical protein
VGVGGVGVGEKRRATHPPTLFNISLGVYLASNDRLFSTQ